MQRRRFLSALAPLLAVPWLAACRAEQAVALDSSMGSDTGSVARIGTPAEAWRGRVSDPAWEVLFKEATERPFSSELDKFWDPGTYLCAACYLPLFRSEDKFDSGTGWPSFTRPIEGHMGTKRDYYLVFPRTEYHCARCGGHQGHVFDDGPPPTGQRWCNNGVALRFVPAGQPLPDLRS